MTSLHVHVREQQRVMYCWCCRTLLELVRYVALLADLSGCSGLCTGAET